MLLVPPDREIPHELPPPGEAAWWFDTLHVAVYRYLVAGGLPPADADEVVQETFLKLYRHLSRHGSRANLNGWIFEVARNAARDRRKSVRSKRTEALDPAARIPDPQAGPEDRAIQAERGRKLAAAIEGLTPQQRECIRLRFAGLRYREIAGVLGIHVSSVAELVDRATARLIEVLP